MKNEVIENRIISKMDTLRRTIPELFSEVSTSYRQKVVYNLLNIVKGGDMNQFLWTLLRLVNARHDHSKAAEIAKTLNELYGYSSKFFEKWAYSIIMGIMSVKTEGGE